jgi:hypothetical protein
MSTYTALQVIDIARTFLDRDGTDGGVANASLLPILSAQYFDLRRRIADVAPDLYTARATFTIAAAASSWTITATDLDRILKLERLYGSQYIPLPLAPILTAEVTFGFRLRGTVIDVFPTSDAPGDYRLTYLTKPTAEITGTNDSLTLPESAQLVLALEIAGMVRSRFDEGAAESQTAAAAWSRLREALVNQYAATPQQIAEIY